MDRTQVAIAGRGPTGLMLAIELRLAGVDVTVLERRDRPTGESRAGGLHARTLEVLDQRGMAEPFLAEGRTLPRGHFAGIGVDFSGCPTRHPYLLVLLQHKVERILAGKATGLGAPIRWNHEVTGVTDTGDGVTVGLDTGTGPRTLRADYLVGCDGGGSTVRKAAGIGFTGTGPTLTALLADVRLDTPPPGPVFSRRTAAGDYSILDFLDDGMHRVMVTDYDAVADRREPVDFAAFRRTVHRIAGTDFGMHSPSWISRFSDVARQADTYRRGRVLLAGDAAHVHYPAGGQGLNLGVQDAVNLGWKLAAVLHGNQPESFLDTYHAERHPVAARVLHNTRAQVALARPGPQVDALRDVTSDLIAQPGGTDRLAGMLTGLDVAYPGDAPGLVGRRMPDIDLAVDGVPTRAHRLLHSGRPVLLRLDTTMDHMTDGRADTVTATGTADTWNVPGLGTVPRPSAVLIRPDGYLAWAATDPGTGGLDAALDTWCGRATATTGPGPAGGTPG